MSARLARLRCLLTVDAKLALRHKLLHVTVIVALVFGALIGFVLPTHLDVGGRDFLLDASEGGRLAPLLALADPAAVFPDPDSLRAAVANTPGSIGVIFEGSAAAPRATVYIQGDESPQRRALIHTGVDALWQTVGGAGPDSSEAPWPAPTVLDPAGQKPPFNQMFVPILFAVDLCLLGFMFGGVMLLQDKQSGTLAALRVSPAGAWDYLASKLLINGGLSLLNLLVLVGLAAPAMLLHARLYPLVLACCLGMTALGLTLAIFVRGIAQFFYPLVLVGLLAATPMYMVFTPTQALAWTRALPTYQVLFGAEAIVFAGDEAVIAEALIYTASFALLTTLLCGWLIHTRLLGTAHAGGHR